MKIEYAYYDTSSNDNELKEAIVACVKYPIDTLSVFPTYLKTVKSLIPDSILLSTPIDYPLGIMESKIRLESVNEAIKNGAKAIELVCPINIICNRKYEKFRDEIKNIIELCSQSETKIRYILEHRQYSYELMYKVAQVLLTGGVDTIYPSTGYLLDNIYDNVLAASLVHQKVDKIKIICNGNIWNDSHIDLIKKTNPYGVRVNSIHSLDLLFKNI
jgi:deoxyribose-phosphate aldolase